MLWQCKSKSNKTTTSSVMENIINVYFHQTKEEELVFTIFTVTIIVGIKE